MSFLDCNGALIPYSYESWRDDSKDVSIFSSFIININKEKKRFFE